MTTLTDPTGHREPTVTPRNAAPGPIAELVVTPGHAHVTLV